MSNRIHFDSSEVDRLAGNLTKAPGRMQRRAPKVFFVGATKIKRGMRRDASGHGHLSNLPGAVNYDRLGDLDYEIGFDKKGQGHLANFAAFGSINNAAVLDLNAPLRREIPFILRHLADEGESAALGGDGQ